MENKLRISLVDETKNDKRKRRGNKIRRNKN